MITLIEALNYRSLKYISQPLGPFHVLIGPNASGKSTFLDVVAFLGRLVSDGVEAAVTERTENFVDLLWKREGTRFEFAIEAALPAEVRAALGNEEYDTIRYEVAVGVVPDSPAEELGILHERVFLKTPISLSKAARAVFPELVESPNTLLHTTMPGWRLIVNRNYGHYGVIEHENDDGYGKKFDIIDSGNHRAALSNLLRDETGFPATTWFRSQLIDGIQVLDLNSKIICRPAPPNKRRGFRPDGSNLPWVVHEVIKIGQYAEWIRHLQSAIPDIKNITTELRPEDRHRYIIIEYANRTRVPSWMVSDGTLRMIALTIPAYLPTFRGIYLIEEPENGIHPKAVETVYQSLSSVYDAQVMIASHSPVMLSCASPDIILCFAKNEEGATDIVTGTNHPRLQEWKGETNLGQLLAAGVLG